MKPSLFPLLLLSATAPLAAQETHNFPTANDGQSHVEITSIFSPPPPTGFVPLRIAVTNGTESDQSVRIDTSSESNSGNNGNSAISTFFISTTSTTVPAPPAQAHGAIRIAPSPPPISHYNSPPTGAASQASTSSS